MRTYRYSPVPTFDLDFDPFAGLFGPVGRQTRSPQYDIVRLDDEHYRIDLAVPGYPEESLAITRDGHHLVVTGEPRPDDPGGALERGIDRGGFQRRFRLGPHTVVHGAKLDAGILHIDVTVELPEDLRPRRIQIGNGAETRPAA